MNTFRQPGAVTMIVTILVTCLVLFLFQKIIWLVVPGLLALMIYYCLRPLVERLVFRGVRHGMAVTATVSVVLLITIGIVLVAAPFLLTRIGQLQNTVDRYLGGGQNLLRKTTQALEEAIPVLKGASLGQKVDLQIQEFTTHFADRYLGKLLLQLLEWLPSLFLVPYLTYFLLKDSTRLKKFLIRSIPNAFFEKSLLLFARLDESLRSFFQGLLVLTFLDTLCLGMGLLVLGVSPAFLLGLLAAVLSWIPYLGSAIGCIMVVLVAATDFPNHPSVAYSCLALFLCVRLLDDFVFLPLTIGRKLHIHPLFKCVDVLSRRDRGRRHRLGSSFACFGSCGRGRWNRGRSGYRSQTAIPFPGRPCSRGGVGKISAPSTTSNGRAMNISFVYNCSPPKGQSGNTPNVQWMKNPDPRRLNVKQRTSQRHENSLKGGCKKSLCLDLNETPSLHCIHSGFLSVRKRHGGCPG